MNKNVLIVLIGGFLVAVLVAVLVQAMIGGKKQEVVEIPRVEILVAAKDLSVGRELREGDLKWQKWPEDNMFAGSIIRDGDQKTMDAVSGKLLRSLVMDQPLHMTVVSEEDQGNFLSANVTKGMRAVGVSVKSYVLADRLIRPGDFVDVMVTYRVRINTRTNPEAQSLVNRYASETVIENIRILAVDTNDTKAVDEEEEGGAKKSKKKSSKNATVTLEVTPEDSEKLVLASRMGEINLALRSIGDNTTTQSDKTTTDVGLSRVMTKLSGMNGTSSGVRVYNGANVEEVKARVVQNGDSVSFDMEESPRPLQTIVIDTESLQLEGEE